MRAGDILVTVNGEYVVVEKIEHELLETPETTYNFEVADLHTYYVGSTEVLVHNEGCGSSKDFFNKPRNAKEVIKHLQNNGFKIISQEGSHVKLFDGVSTVIVPNHGAKEIAIGTLKSILKESKLR